MRKILFWIIVAVVLVIFGMPSVLALQWDPSWNPFRPSPEQVIGRAFVRLKDVRALHVDASMDSLAGKTIHVAGDVNIANLQSIISEGKMSFSQKEDTPFLKADYKVIGQDAYVSMVDSNITFLGVEVKKVVGQWIKFSLPGYSFLHEMKEKVAGQDMYTVKSKLPDETIGGQKIYRYLVTLNADALKNMAGDSAGNFFDTAGEMNVELSIGSKDYYLYGVAMEKRIDFNSIYPVGPADASLYIDLQFSQFNETVTVKPPASFRKLEEVFK